MAAEVFRKIWDICIRPKEFFEGIVSETDIWKPVTYYSILSLIVLPLNIILFCLLGLILDWAGFFVFLLTFIVGMAIFFGFLFLYHWIISLFGGNKGLLRTFQAFIYGVTPGLVLSWIPIVNIFAAIYSIVLTIIGISKLHEIKAWKAAVAYFVPLIAVFVLSLVLFLLIGF
jgi:hypothetical protein